MTGFDPASLGLIAGGVGLSSLGSALGATSTNRAARQARDFYDRRSNEGLNRLAFALWGVDPTLGLFGSAQLGSPQSPEDRAGQLGQFQNAFGGPLIGQMNALSNAVTQRQRGDLSYFDRQTGQLGGQDAALQRIVAQSYGQSPLAAMPAMAADYGDRQERVARTDAERDRRNAVDRGRAALASSGFDGSLVGNLETGAARDAGERLDRTLSSIADQRFGRQMQAASAFQTQAINPQAQALERVLGQSTGRAYQRDADRMRLNQGFLDRDINMRLNPINTQMSVLQGAVANPWLGQNTSQYYPGLSAGGSFATNLGGALTAGGGYLGGQNQQSALLEQMLARLAAG